MILNFALQQGRGIERDSFTYYLFSVYRVDVLEKIKVEKICIYIINNNLLFGMVGDKGKKAF